MLDAKEATMFMTTSDYEKGMQCPKMLWAEANAPEVVRQARCAEHRLHQRTTSSVTWQSSLGAASAHDALTVAVTPCM